MTAVDEGDRFEEIEPTGVAGVLWQVVSVDTEDDRVHLFNVDDPVEIRTVHRERLLDVAHYRRITGGTGTRPEAA